MFSEFLSNRVQAVVSVMSAGLFSDSTRQKEAATVLISDGSRTAAILPISETPFSLSIPAVGSDQIVGKVGFLGRPMTTGALFFLATDPRVVAIPVQPPASGAPTPKVYPVAKNPFRFTEAVLISRGGKYYGEVEFKLDPRLPEYVKMKSRILSRVFGEFSPSTGDLVLSKTGEFLGIMVNSDYCLVVKNLQAAEGGIFDAQQTREQTRTKLEGFRARIDRLPLPLR